MRYGLLVEHGWKDLHLQESSKAERKFYSWKDQGNLNVQEHLPGKFLPEGSGTMLPLNNLIVACSQSIVSVARKKPCETTKNYRRHHPGEDKFDKEMKRVRDADLHHEWFYKQVH
jgi:hypothetical protein